jgi:hypothetical protein
MLVNVGMVGRIGGVGVGSGSATGPSLDMDFAGSGVLDSRITFTRAAGPATYFDSSGVLQTAGTNVPRFDYDPVTHVAKGLLIEETRTNLAFPSVPATVWTATGPVSNVGTTTAPDGTNTGVLFSATSTASAIRQYMIAIPITAATVYTVSAYFKTAGTNAYLQINNTAPTAAFVAYFDLTNGTAVVGADLVAGITAKSVTITAAGNGWYRATTTFTSQAAATAMQFYIGPCTVVSSSGDNRAYTGVIGQGVYVWGADVEAGTFATSYITTTGAAATRAADIATTPTGSWFNAAQSSAVVEAMLAVSSTTVFGGHISFNDATQTNRLQLASLAFIPKSVVTSAGVNSVVNPETTAITSGVAYKFGCSLVAGTFRSSLNGATPYQSTTGIIMPVGVTTLSLGNVPQFNDAALNGWIRRVRYWPRAMPAAELQGATT